MEKNEETRKRLSLAVKELRHDKSLRVFAAEIQISHPRVLEWEKGTGFPNLEPLQKLAQMRGETVEQFTAWLNGHEQLSPMDRLLTQIRALPKNRLLIVLKEVSDCISA